MQAVILREFGPIDGLEFTEVPDPSPGPDDVVVAVRAVAANYVDLLVIAGSYQFLPARPFSPGKLPVGDVIATGTNVTGLKPGDRVLTLAEAGGYAERVCVPAGQCYILPGAMTYVEAATMSLAYDTAWFALRERARYQTGEKVLVLGASGSVGLAAVQLAKAFGAFVIGGVARPDAAQRVRDAGADAIVDLSQPNLNDALRERVREATGGDGVDIVLDPLGGEFFTAALRALAWCGRLVVIGFAAGTIPSVKANYLLVKNIEVSGLQISDYRKRKPALMAACIAELFALVQSGALRIPEATTYRLEDFSSALHALHDRTKRGRIVLTPQRAG